MFEIEQPRGGGRNTLSPGGTIRMRRKLALLSVALLCLSSPQLFALAAFVNVDLVCGTTTSIYANSSSGTMSLTIQATDKCAGADSELDIINSKARIVTRFILKDGTTKAFHLSIPSGSSLSFVCNGNSGGCSYQLSIPVS
jgi:hypothetical protein